MAAEEVEEEVAAADTAEDVDRHHLRISLARSHSAYPFCTPSGRDQAFCIKCCSLNRSKIMQNGIIICA